MSNTTRELSGRVDVIYGNEEQDGGISIRQYSVPINKSMTTKYNGACQSLPKDLANSLISPNSTYAERACLQFSKYKIRRGARFYNPSRALLMHQHVGGIKQAVGIRVEFNENRPVHRWTVAGVGYLLNEVAAYKFIEIPANFDIILWKNNTDVIVKRTCMLVMPSSGSVMSTITIKVFDGVQEVSSVALSNEEMCLVLGSDVNARYDGVDVVIREWRSIAVNLASNVADLALIDSDANERLSDMEKVVKLTKCYDNQLERYEGSAVQSFDIVRELPNSNNDINYGVISNTFKATLLNEGRKLDMGYLKDEVTLGRRVVPFVETNGVEVRLGTFYVSEWRLPMDNSWVELEAKDRMFDFRDTMYQGFFPEPREDDNTKFKPVSMYDIVLSIIECINANFLVSLTNRIYAGDQLRLLLEKVPATCLKRDLINKRYMAGKKVVEGIDLELDEYTINDAYLPRQPIWDALENVAQSSLSHVYIDKVDRLIVTTDWVDQTHMFIDGQLIARTIGGSVNNECTAHQSRSNRSTQPVPQSITSANAFSMHKPNVRKACASEVTTSFTTYNFGATGSGDDETLITYYLSELSVHEIIGDRVYYKISVPQYCDRVISKSSDNIISESGKNAVINNHEQYFIVSILLADFNNVDFMTSANVALLGVTIGSNTSSVMSRVVVKENKNTLAYTAGTLLNCATNAQALVKRLTQLYSGGREIFETEWMGDSTVDIDAPVKFTLPTNQQEYMFKVTGSSITFDGGLRQNIKAMSYFKK